MSKPRILCVDDEEGILVALRRLLRRNYSVYRALSGAEALEILEQDGPFAVVVSDLVMPEMDGIELLLQVRTRSPDTVRVLLTGQANLHAAVESVNKAGIFRFLLKPFRRDTLNDAVRDAVGQHALIRAERELLERTVVGSINVLIQILGVTHPEAFKRANLIKEVSMALADRLTGGGDWEIETAAMLADLGLISLSNEDAAVLFRGGRLDARQREAVERIPDLGADLIASIPRLEPVAALVRQSTLPASKNPPLPSRIIKVASAYATLQARGLTVWQIVQILTERTEIYDADVVEALPGVVSVGEPSRFRHVEYDRLVVGMVLASELRTLAGVKLLPKGCQITQPILERIRNYHVRIGIEEPVKVYTPGAAPTDDTRR